MTSIEDLKSQRQQSVEATRNGPPEPTQNRFFGVGPITDMTVDEVDSRRLRFAFDRWLEDNYPKLDDKGNKVGSFTTAEFNRSMHRGYPADKVLADMLREIHRYFEFPVANRLAVGLGGGHSGFTVCAQHFLNANDVDQHVYVDTPRPESKEAKSGGFFRQSWGAQLIEMLRHSKNGDEDRIVFSGAEGEIPSADELQRRGIKVVFGVGHETTGATTYSETEIRNLLDWLDRDPANHHAIIDGTSMLGAMPWADDIVSDVMHKCCIFAPFQKAIGGVSGYFVVSLTPQALQLIDNNMEDPSWAIPRQLKIAVPQDPRAPLSGKASTSFGPIYNPETGTMAGGVINTFSILAFAETTFGLLRAEEQVGSMKDMNARSIKNRAAINEWVDENPLFELGVSDVDKRGAAVTLLKVADPDTKDADVHARIIAKSKQMLGYEGVTHVNGHHEKGLDVARYVNAFPGTPGDYRAWIGGIRPHTDVIALLENIKYAYHRAKIAVLEELLSDQGEAFPAYGAASGRRRVDDRDAAYKVLIADLVGLKFLDDGSTDHSDVKAHIESKGGAFHVGSAETAGELAGGKIHFFYQPHLSKEDELLNETSKGQYDALIAAATFIPEGAQFREGGVRIGAGTGNMGSKSWGGGNGGGDAPLMNTPSFNSRATAQMGFKALLKVFPDLPVQTLHDRVIANDFDTGKNLAEFPTEKLEGKRIGVLGYGNIGREMAKLAKAFGMDVVIYARSRHQEWIESEGFTYAASAEEAAKNADVLSMHLGLGNLDAQSGTFANAGAVNSGVLSQLNDRAVVINYDRGELIDAAALDEALTSGKVRYAAIDADIFKDEETGAVTGPMAPYLALAERHSDKLELLPHAAADTDHFSRVDGAKQAVDQIYEAIQYRHVTNLKGDLPEGYVQSGRKTVDGVGQVTIGNIQEAALAEQESQEFRDTAERMAAFWGAVGATKDADQRQTLIERYGVDLVRDANKYTALLNELGLCGPYAK